jgi:hypothetical protein
VGPTSDVLTLSNFVANKPLSKIMHCCRPTYILLTVLKYPNRTVCTYKCVCNTFTVICNKYFFCSRWIAAMNEATVLK